MAASILALSSAARMASDRRRSHCCSFAAGRDSRPRGRPIAARFFILGLIGRDFGIWRLTRVTLPFVRQVSQQKVSSSDTDVREPGLYRWFCGSSGRDGAGPTRETPLWVASKPIFLSCLVQTMPGSMGFPGVCRLMTWRRNPCEKLRQFRSKLSTNDRQGYRRVNIRRRDGMLTGFCPRSTSRHHRRRAPWRVAWIRRRRSGSRRNPFMVNVPRRLIRCMPALSW